MKERYAEVCQRVARAARGTGRESREIILIAVSKYAGMDEVRELVALGHVDFGENQVQQMQQRSAMVAEWQQRQRGLSTSRSNSGPAEGVRWHMVGRLQRNKVRKAIETSRLIHSVDNLRVAEEIQNIAMRLDRTIDVLMQVNASGEGSKQGVLMPAAIHLAEQMETMMNIRLRGIMTMAPHAERPEDSRECFSRTRELFEDMKRIGVVAPHFNILSMGMSADYEVAISEGANMIRVGSGIFGQPAAQGEGESADDEDD